MKPTQDMSVSPSPHRRTRQPLRVSHNNNVGETSPERSDGSGCKFSEGLDVLARWNDGLNYLGTILKVDNIIEQCYIKFEDDSEYWALFKDITVVAGHRSNRPALKASCSVCKGDGSCKPNEMIICDSCGLGYHQKCHIPHISSEAVHSKKPWVCRACLFSSSGKKSGPLRKKQTAKSMKQSLPYDPSSLHWDLQKKSNKEQCYCYCGGPGHWYIKMLQCCRCKQWFHEACVDCLKYPLVSGDRFYIFACAVCNHGTEYARRLQLKWEDLVQLCLFDLTMDFQKKYFGFNESMMPWINRHWDTLQVGELENFTETERAEKVTEVLLRLSTKFQCGREVKKKTSLWSLRKRIPPPAPHVTLPNVRQLTDAAFKMIEVHPVRSGKWLIGETDCPPIPARKRRLSGDEAEPQRKKKRRKLNTHHRENGLPNNQSYQGYNGSSSKYTVTSRPESPLMNGHHDSEDEAKPCVTHTPKSSSKHKDLQQTLDSIIPWPQDYEGSNHPFKTVLEQEQEVRNSKLRASFINSYLSACSNGTDNETDSFTEHTDSECPTPTEEPPPPLLPPTDEETKNLAARIRSKPGRKTKYDLAILAADQARREREGQEMGKLLTKPRMATKNVIDKSTLDAVAKKEVPLTQLKSSLQCYFGAAERLANGERYKVLARRVTPEGKMQYLVEWESLVP